MGTATKQCALKPERAEDYSNDDFDHDPPTQPIPAEVMAQLVTKPVRS